MKKISFTIYGNHKSTTGNAVPKLKMVRNQQWTAKAQEYVKWKNYVVSLFLYKILDKSYDNNYARYKKPIILNLVEHALLICNFYWSNKTHGDAENCIGSIADALFKDDKRVDVFTISQMSNIKQNGKPKGKVDVSIFLFPSENEKISFIRSRFIY